MSKLAGVFGALAVAFGAFGAHGLKGKVDPAMIEVWNTAAHYHLIHSVALLFVKNTKSNQWTETLFATGITLFSGSLYVMVLTGIRRLGAITPIGGMFLIGGWVSLIY